MGKGSKFFYSSDTEAITLFRRLLPSNEKREMQSERWNALADFLTEWFKLQGIKVTHWLQGSCKFGTQIRPLHKERSDVDLGLYAEWSGNAPPANVVKGLVQEALIEYVAHTPGAIGVLEPPKERACRIIFDQHFHVDVPIYHFNPVNGRTLLATETKGWEESNPGKMVDWFLREAGSEDDRTQLRRMIRYMKGLASVKFEKEQDRPSSTLLTVLATRAYKGITTTLPDDEMLTEICRRIGSTLQRQSIVENPVNGQEDLNRMKPEITAKFIDELKQLVRIGESTLALNQDFHICNRWAEVFGPLFPITDFAHEDRDGKNLPALIQPEISIVARPKKPTGRTYSGRNQIGPIPKDCQIVFTIVSNLPQKSVAHWTVRNKGEEAEEGNDLGHHAGTGLSVSRNSAYNGSHFMDCTIKDINGRVLGFRRVVVQIFNGIVRNARAPGYRRIPGIRR